ncbi:hypothetical protein VTP01DRAFT_8349 [Rhizomucor pusillus]|uniref:uncharacterized protein n=1 Tax=Rhizomucor pusillus TaxID=4840 RepID=UPI003742B87A
MPIVYTDPTLSNVHSLAVAANGIFAGLGVSINFVVIPVLRALGYPAKGWAVTYDRGKYVAISTILVSSISHFYLYHKTGQSRALYCGLLSLVSAPYTALAMKPTNTRLQELEKSKVNVNMNESQALIEKWNMLQWFRTIVGNAAFALALIE